MSEQQQKDFHFFVDGKRYTTTKGSLNGAEIKAMAGVTATYQLFLEEEGDKPDRQISDTEAVSLHGEIKHFFAVPPATFGNK